ncbi:SusC/RagA family TonB-linked outer membrane protein [Pedobacter africanus]|uniref:SusC/RagA family TonB-linked outer membrane protein n=1 Tax=Pedobacter africanus TaxID=151894 RepID=UPI001F1CD55E|nr:SusC/RagA family TonB-linked outer membrane protein [Pedobacter africanus]
MLASLMQVSASSLAQRISLSEKGSSLSRVFEKIKSQAGIDFVVSTEILKSSRPVDINVRNVQLTEVLKAIFKDQPLEYSIEDKFVVVRKKDPSVLDKAKSVLMDFMLNLTVKGRVVDEKGTPLAGATVTVKGEKQGVRTGADGLFALQNVKEGAIVVITYTGFKTREIAASGDLGTIRMEIAVGDLAEVGITVNTGYQRIKPEQSTGAVAQIGTKEYESRVSSNFLDGLVNRLPGLMINNDVNFTSTAPDGSRSSRPLFNIRGISTMSANQSPLIVVDGYPTTLTLDMIDPNEIKSVTILKDAAAATVYGVRASNGVIVIERKQAIAGKPQFNYRTTLGFKPKEDYARYRWDDNASSVVTNYLRTTQSAIVNATSWGLLSTASAGAINRSAPYYIAAQAAAGMITPAQAESAYAELASYDNIDDYSRLFERTAITQTHNLNVSGGNENALYYITGNYTGNRNNKVLDDNSRILFSARSTIKLSRKLALELTTDYNEQRFNNAPTPGPATYNPYERFQDITGAPTSIIGASISAPYNTFIMSQGLEDDAIYPLIDMNEIRNTTRSVNNKFTANFKYDLGKGFDLNFGGIYETSRSELKYLASERSSVVKRYINDYAARQADGTLKFNIPKGGYLRQQNLNTSSYTARAQLNYNKKFGDHSINAILGGEARSLIDRSNLTTSFGYNDETLLQQGVDYGSIVSNAVATRGTYGMGSSLQNQIDALFNQKYVEDRFLSGYSNLVYAYKNRYSATGSIRIDQSNLFGTNPKYKYKPLWSLGAAWNIHNEPFMQNLVWVNQLKLRTAYGFNGNVAKLSLPEVIAQARFNINTSPVVPALGLVSYANSSLRWEQTKNFNAGLDFSIFKNINGSIDYYTKKSTDLLGNSLIDPTLGVSPTLINQATIRNNGLEFSLKADWIARRNFNWNTGIVVARNSSKVLDVFRKGDFNPQTLDVLGYVKGYPVGAMFAYNTVGLDNTGYPILEDANGNIIQTNNNSLGSPQTAAMASETSGLVRYAGSSLPTVNAGLSNRVDVGNFYFFAMINYYGGFKVRVPRPDLRATRPLQGAGNYWKAPGDEFTTDVMALAAFSSANSNNAYNYASSYVVHGDYLTLGDLTASYSLENLKFLKNAGFRNFEIKVQASNIYTVGFNRYNYSRAIGNFEKAYITPTYTLALFTNF